MAGRRLSPAPVLLGALAALMLAGCARSLAPDSRSHNQAPEVAFVRPPAPGGAPAWIATDPDGRVDHFLVSTDARAFRDARHPAERTQATRWTPPVAAAAAAAGPAAPSRLTVRAVDERGAVSEPAIAGFFGSAMAPYAEFVSPRPRTYSAIPIPVQLDVTFRVTPSGEPGSAIASIRYLLAKRSDLGDPLLAAILDSASATINRQWAPDFPGWSTLPGDADRIALRDLEVETEYLLVLTAFDERGLYDPVFEVGKNLLRLVAQPTSYFAGPHLQVTTGVMSFAYGVPQAEPRLSLAALLPSPAWETIPFTVTATGSTERPLAGIRWALDPADYRDESPRRNDQDLSRWSGWSDSPLRMELPPFSGPDARRDHLLYFEARDSWGIPSYLLLRVRPVPLPDHRRRLLVVNDTRFTPDLNDLFGHPQPPSGIWPTAAELDTFLHARGGFPWRGYPAGTQSPAGVFSGYDYDTVSTRDPARWPVLDEEMLGRYESVIWITDGFSALYTGAPGARQTPTTMLRFMSTGGIPNPLPGYVARGGRLWLVGGGIGMASTGPFNRGAFSTFASPAVDPAEGELVPGRLLVDLAGWRSRVETFFITTNPLRTVAGDVRPGHEPRWLYPERLRLRNPATDPLPPGRPASAFYGTPSWTEMITSPNVVTADPGSGTQEAPLDTLYKFPYVSGSGGGRVFAAMTRFQVGRGTVLFSGFDLWSWSRADCRALADAVLRGEWAMSRGHTVIAAAASRAAQLGRPVPAPVDAPRREQ